MAEIAHSVGAIFMVDMAHIAGLVAAGFGIAIVPKIPLLDTMYVCVRPIISPEIERYIYLVLKKEKYLTPVVKDFISFITELKKYRNVWYTEQDHTSLSEKYGDI